MTEDPDRWRVLSYNLRGLKDDQAAMARVVRACGPDLLCAQEVPHRLLAGWRLRRLGRRLGLVRVCGGLASGGPALLVAPDVEVLARRAARLPVRSWWTPTRGYAVARVRRPGGAAVTVISIHLGLQADERADHVGRILSLLGDLPGPYVVAGDLNEPPGGPSWLALSAVVRDCVAIGDPETCHDRPTFSSRSLRRRIDAVLVSDGVRVRQVRPADASDGVRALDLVAASDHLPLIADLTIGAGD
jgi:endonuclease/exonuclease/phosphatase family metal-dependent hydrolase